MNTKIYSEKLPLSVRNAMFEFTNEQCLLVKKKLDSNINKSLNCHYNVEEYVNNCGGNMINGWLLCRNKEFIDNGIWIWTYHSVWRNENGDIYDITIDRHNNRDYSTFNPDKSRNIDLNNGISYNNIIVFQSTFSIANFDGNFEEEIEIGKAYWTLENRSMLRNIDTYNGQYRLLRSEFPNNIKQLEQEYQLTIVDGKLKSKNAETNVHHNFLFEYSVRSRTS